MRSTSARLAYAMTLRASRCRVARIAPYSAPTVASARRYGYRSAIPRGKRGRQMRAIAYTAVFESTPASTIATGAGAAT